MKNTRYCKDCKRNVTPKKFSILTFWAMIFTGVVLTVAIIGWPIIISTIIYWRTRRKPKCPICNGVDFK